MQLYGIESIDDSGKITLPKELRQKTKFKAKRTVATKSDVVLRTIGRIVVIQPEKEPEEQQHMGGNDIEIGRFVSDIDHLGRIELPYELIREMGWCIGYMIALYCVYDGMLVLVRVG